MNSGVHRFPSPTLTSIEYNICSNIYTIIVNIVNAQKLTNTCTILNAGVNDKKYKGFT